MRQKGTAWALQAVVAETINAIAIGEYCPPQKKIPPDFFNTRKGIKVKGKSY